MKLNRPKAINCSDSNFNEAINDSFSNVIIEAEPDENIVISDVTFDSCIFKNIDFSNIELNNVKKRIFLSLVNDSFIILKKFCFFTFNLLRYFNRYNITKLTPS